MINVNQQALLELLKASLFGAESHFPEGVDWDAVLQEAKDQAVVALAAPAVPDSEMKKWDIHIRRNKMQFMQILNEQRNLVRIFETAGIPMVILKGFAAAMYYPEPINRTMGDIDFIVPPERFEEARRMMEENGYTYIYDLGNDRDYTYRKNDIAFELHHHYSDKDWDVESLILDGINRSVWCKVYNISFPALPEEINGLVLLDHVRHHLDGGLGIRQIIDWMMFVHSTLNGSEWEDRFAPVVKRAGLEKLAITMTKMCKLWLGLPDDIQWCEEADEETAWKLLETVLDFGNFGHKVHHANKTGESIALRSQKGNLLRFLQRTGIEEWKACQKHRFLRPFAWLYQLFRYFGMGVAALLRGENIVKDYFKGKKKVAFYQNLGIDKCHTTNDFFKE